MRNASSPCPATPRAVRQQRLGRAQAYRAILAALFNLHPEALDELQAALHGEGGTPRAAFLSPRARSLAQAKALASDRTETEVLLAYDRARVEALLERGRVWAAKWKVVPATGGTLDAFLLVTSRSMRRGPIGPEAMRRRLSQESAVMKRMVATEGDVIKRSSLLQHAEWFVRFQVDGLSYDKIAGDIRRADAVRLAIKELSALVGVSRRTGGRPGRPAGGPRKP
jgi:hypothetical protein